MKLRTGDVVWIRIDNAIGCQQNGSRYGVVISNNIGNKFSPTVEILPGTTQRNDSKQPTHAKFLAGEVEGLKRDTVFEAESIWTVNKFQIKRVVGRLTNDQMKRIAEAIVYQIPIVSAAFDNGITKTEKFQKIQKAS